MSGFECCLKLLNYQPCWTPLHRKEKVPHWHMQSCKNFVRQWGTVVASRHRKSTAQSGFAIEDTNGEKHKGTPTLSSDFVVTTSLCVRQEVSVLGRRLEQLNGIAVDLGGPNEKYEPLSLPMLGFYPAAAKTPFSIVNPVFTHRSNATMSMWDDCMSFPHLMVRLRRHCSVSLEFYTVVQLQDMGSGYGAPKTTPDTSNAMRAHGTLVAANDTEGIVHVVWHNLPPEVSELLQHEVDHLDGVLAVDHVQPGADEDIVDRNTWLKHQDQYNGTVDYVIVPTV
eukprot:m.202298 g.202298  ORF g.202298 m.202298 type:complete len:281 (-) comp18824_c0_seq3:297-1139(-)